MIAQAMLFTLGVAALWSLMPDRPAPRFTVDPDQMPVGPIIRNGVPL
ncbi:hypothetical protein ACK8HH_17320 [Gordonia sp. LUNF6]|nr:hypothetical protein [Gordonia sp. QH-12]